MAESFCSSLTVTWLYKRVIYLIQFLTVLQGFFNFRRKNYFVNAFKDATMFLPFSDPILL